MSIPALSDVTSNVTQRRFNTALHGISFFIAPSYTEGSETQISSATLTPIHFFFCTFEELTNTVGRFFARKLPLIVIGRKQLVMNDDEFIPLMDNVSFLHQESCGFHLLARIDRFDVTGKEARKRLQSVAEKLEYIKATTPANTSESS